jgi:hypothetical protein
MLYITGLPLIFYHEIDHLRGASIDPPELAGAAAQATASLDGIVADARTCRPQDAVQYVARDPEEPNAWYIGLGEKPDAPELTAYYTYDARSGELLAEYPLNEGFIYVLWRLHYDLYAGLAGTLFLGLMGLMLVASLVSGIVLYGPFMTKLAFGTVRRQRSPRTRCYYSGSSASPRTDGVRVCHHPNLSRTTKKRRRILKASSLAIGALLVAHAAYGADFSGTWNISSTVGDNPVSIQCTLLQNGDELTGTCQPQNFEPSALRGSVSGSTAKWGYDVVFNGNENHVEYEASLSADGSLSGTLHLGSIPAPFTAGRQ